jgi:hypothetical protein
MTAMRSLCYIESRSSRRFHSSPARPTNTALQLNVDHIWFGAFFKRSQMFSDLSHLLPLMLLLLDQVALDCAQK